MTRKYNESFEVGKKLASGCLESSGTAYKRHKLCILVGYRSHTHRPCPLCIMHVPSAHEQDCPRISIGKGRRQPMFQLYDNADASIARRARGMCS